MPNHDLSRPIRAAGGGLLCLALLATAAAAQAPITQKPYEPTVGQEGKDAVWVPTSLPMVERMLDHAKLTPQDFVMDLGSGDGRTIIAAAKRGARGLGVEFNPDLVEYSKRQAAAQGVGDKAMFVQGDMYAADISKATVLALFLLPSNLEKLAPKFLALPPGTRIVANTFWISDWTPDDTVMLKEGCENWCTSHLFIIPGKAQGKWQLPDGVLALTQKYQMVEGTYTPTGGAPVQAKGRMRGNDLTILVGDAQYAGRITGNRIEGVPTDTPNAPKIVGSRIE
jgi:precorrin-6B methylase 2